MFELIISDYKINGFKVNKIIILTLYRVGNYVYYSKINKFTKNLIMIILNIIRKLFVELLFNVEIPFECRIGKSLRIMHPNGIIIHKNAVLGDNCTLFHQVTIGANEHKNKNNVANIGNYVYIGCGAKIIGDIDIGDNCIIAANSVVVKDLPSNFMVYSQQIIKHRKV
ncbi:serine acetyltransferase [Clostridium perfringens]|nr:serine acetyltransferase [Clostridium perfringens]EHK2442956.1 serine acetyltransferase [Clostridium perfringens]